MDNFFVDVMKIVTWNVNSIRARIPNFLELVNILNPDVILLQELKCLEEQFPFEEFENLNYNIKIVGQKARNGVAILSKFPLYDVNISLPLYGIADSDSEARYIDACIDYKGNVVRVGSIYAPNGGPTVLESKGLKDVTDTDTFRNKIKFFDRLKLRFHEFISNNEIAIFGGDYNICPNINMDVYSPDKDGVISCTSEERKKFSSLIESGMTDIWRKLNPELKDFTWWGYRPYYMWEKNLGYRLDAIMVTPFAEKLIDNCKILREIRGQEKASDHVPMYCEFK